MITDKKTQPGVAAIQYLLWFSVCRYFPLGCDIEPFIVTGNPNQQQKKTNFVVEIVNLLRGLFSQNCGGFDMLFYE